MRRGLVIGKFMPLHRGHIGLVRFAAAHCDELIISMTYTSADPIQGPVRYEWLKEEFRIYPKIKIEISVDDFDDNTLSWKERIPRWVEFLKKRFPSIDLIFSSEEYGPMVADAMSISHVAFDPERKEFPVSGELIRSNPFLYWDMIAAPARGYFVKRICFYGPESTGKTVLSERMATLYQTSWVPEVARELISSNDFTVDDIVNIGHVQTQRILEKTKTANKILFCDTDVITTEIYCRKYLGTVPSVLFELEKQIVYDHYLLFDIDVPWVADGMRDLKNERPAMFEIFRDELTKRRIVPIVVKGSHEQRFATVNQLVAQLLPPNLI